MTTKKTGDVTLLKGFEKFQKMALHWAGGGREWKAENGKLKAEIRVEIAGGTAPYK